MLHSRVTSILAAAPLVAVAICANPALTQEATTETPGPQAEAELAPTDWNLVEVPERKATLATAEFDNGLTLVARCVDGVFEATVHGLPEAKGLTRNIQVTVNDHRPYESNWIIGTTRTAAFSTVPVRFARALAEGGTLQLRVPQTPTNPPTRYVLDLPPSTSAVEQTLAACGKSMLDLRHQHLGDETGLPAAITWDIPPRPSFPSSSGPTYSTVGFVTLTCVTRVTGRVEECEIESEYPAGYGFGRAVQRSVRKAKLKSTDPNLGVPDGELIIFTTNFRMD